MFIFFWKELSYNPLEHGDLQALPCPSLQQADTRPVSTNFNIIISSWLSSWPGKWPWWPLKKHQSLTLNVMKTMSSLSTKAIALVIFAFSRSHYVSPSGVIEMKEDARPNFYQQQMVQGVAQEDGVSKEAVWTGETKDPLPLTEAGQITGKTQSARDHAVVVCSLKKDGAITQDLRMVADTVRALVEYTECVIYRSVVFLFLLLTYNTWINCFELHRCARRS